MHSIYVHDPLTVGERRITYQTGCTLAIFLILCIVFDLREHLACVRTAYVKDHNDPREEWCISTIIMLEIHHSGREPSHFFPQLFCCLVQGFGLMADCSA